MYFCKICAKPQNSFQPRYRGISCNACLVFFQRSIYSEPNFKCKKFNACLNGPPKQILRCRKCRYERCIRVGMPAPFIRPLTSFKKISSETAKLYAYTIDTLLSIAVSQPKLLIAYLKKENETIFNISFEAAKNYKVFISSNVPQKIECLANLLQNNLIDVKNELEILCFLCVCKFNFTHLPENEKEEMRKLQNNGFRKLENEKINTSVLFEWMKISKQCLNIIEIFSFV